MLDNHQKVYHFCVLNKRILKIYWVSSSLMLGTSRILKDRVTCGCTGSNLLLQKRVSKFGTLSVKEKCVISACSSWCTSLTTSHLMTVYCEDSIICPWGPTYHFPTLKWCESDMVSVEAALWILDLVVFWAGDLWGHTLVMLSSKQQWAARPVSHVTTRDTTAALQCTVLLSMMLTELGVVNAFLMDDVFNSQCICGDIIPSSRRSCISDSLFKQDWRSPVVWPHCASLSNTCKAINQQGARAFCLWDAHPPPQRSPSDTVRVTETGSKWRQDVLTGHNSFLNVLDEKNQITISAHNNSWHCALSQHWR